MKHTFGSKGICRTCGCSRDAVNRFGWPCQEVVQPSAARVLVPFPGGSKPAVARRTEAFPIGKLVVAPTVVLPQQAGPAFVLGFTENHERCHLLQRLPSGEYRIANQSLIYQYKYRQIDSLDLDLSSQTAMQVLRVDGYSEDADAPLKPASVFLEALDSNYTRHFLYRLDAHLNATPWPFLDGTRHWLLVPEDAENYRLTFGFGGAPIPRGFVYYASVGYEPAYILERDGISFGPVVPRGFSFETLYSADFLATAEGQRMLAAYGIKPPPQIVKAGEENLGVLKVDVWSQGDSVLCKTYVDWDISRVDGRDEFAGPVLAETGSYLEQNPDVEADANQTVETLSKRGFTWRPTLRAWVARKKRDFTLSLFALLDGLPKTARVRMSDDMRLIKRHIFKAAARLQVTKSGLDWFDVNTEMELEGGDVTLTEEQMKLLVQARGATIELGENQVGSLEVVNAEAVSGLGFTPAELLQGAKRLHTLHLQGLVESVAPDVVDLLDPATQKAIRKRVKAIAAYPVPRPPREMRVRFRKYQIEGFRFLVDRTRLGFGVLLADDMGLGKTLQALAWWLWLSKRENKSKPTLVVCPKSVASNWVREAQRFIPGVRICAMEGQSPKALINDHDIIVCNYVEARQHQALAEIDWFAVILDEAQNIKTPGCLTSIAACSFRSKYRVALTGTPIENRLTDLWSIMHFLAPELLGGITDFRRKFRDDDPSAAGRLAIRVRPFLLRRTKSEVELDLPPKTEEDIHVRLAPKQRELYQAEVKLAQAQLMGIHTPEDLRLQRMHILTSLLRLRQICCHPQLVNGAFANAESAKLEALMETVGQIVEQGHKVLVFSAFVEMLNIIEAKCLGQSWATFKLTGQTNRRQTLIDQFNSMEGAGVFLVSLKAGGAGINLTSASYVVHYDPWWNLAAESQATDRAHRIGQTRPVIVYRMLAENTIESKIRLLQQQKGNLAAGVIDGASFTQALTLQDLEYIFSETEIDRADDLANGSVPQLTDATA